jgi:hypothetical protein
MQRHVTRIFSGVQIQNSFCSARDSWDFILITSLCDYWLAYAHIMQTPQLLQRAVFRKFKAHGLTIHADACRAVANVLAQ